MSTEQEHLYDIEAARQRLGGVSQWAVVKWLSQGRLERTKVGRRTMISERAIQAFLLECAMRGSKGRTTTSGEPAGTAREL